MAMAVTTVCMFSSTAKSLTELLCATEPVYQVICLGDPFLYDHQQTCFPFSGCIFEDTCRATQGSRTGAYIQDGMIVFETKIVKLSGSETMPMVLTGVGERSLHLTAVYRSPSSDTGGFPADLDSYLLSLPNAGKHVVVGHLNINLPKPRPHTYYNNMCKINEKNEKCCCSIISGQGKIEKKLLPVINQPCGQNLKFSIPTSKVSISNSKCISSEIQMASVLASYFTQIAEKLANTFFEESLELTKHSNIENLSGYFRKVNPVAECISLQEPKHLDKNKCQCLNSSLAKMVKLTAHCLTTPLTCNSNPTIEITPLPDKMTISKVLPVLPVNKGSRTYPSNCYPIMVLPTFAKSFKPVINAHPQTIMKLKSSTSGFENGFKKEIEAQDTPIKFANQSYSAPDRSQMILGIVELFKTFDSTNDNILQGKQNQLYNCDDKTVLICSKIASPIAINSKI